MMCMGSQLAIDHHSPFSHSYHEITYRMISMENGIIIWYYCSHGSHLVMYRSVDTYMYITPIAANSKYYIL